METRVYFLENYMGNANLNSDVASKFVNSSQTVCKNILSVSDSTRLRIPRDAYIDIVTNEAEFEENV
jgi:hypothetical protein